MKKNNSILFLLKIVLCLAIISCSNNDDSDSKTSKSPESPIANINLLSDFWFGYYQEDAVTNPEDPLPGFIYLKVPESGNFEGELYFSYSGCEGGIDIGRVEGTVANNTLDGSWAGIVDNKTVGGDYTGNLINDELYEGTYTNTGGKIEIVCDDSDLSYFVAPKGTWFIQKTGNNDVLDIKVNTDADPVSISWNPSNESSIIYSAVFVDAECLESNLDLEQCLMWNGLSTNSSIVYGQGINDDVPARRLVTGKTYLASITCVNTNTGQATVISNITFVAK